MESILTFIGRFHPLIVHLPIGFILLALLLEFNRSKFKESEKNFKVHFVLGASNWCIFNPFRLFTIPTRRLPMGVRSRPFLFGHTHLNSLDGVLYISRKENDFKATTSLFLFNKFID